MNPRSSAGSGWRWITTAIMAHDAALPRPRRDRHLSVRQARAGEATPGRQRSRADRLRQGRPARADRPDDQARPRGQPDGDLDLPARGGTAGAARGCRRLVRTPLRRAAGPGHRDRPDLRFEGGDLPPGPGRRRPRRRQAAGRHDAARLSGPRSRGDLRRRGGRAAAALRARRLPARLGRGARGDMGARRDRLAELPEQPDRRRRSARVPPARRRAFARARVPARLRRGVLRAVVRLTTPLRARGTRARERRRLKHAQQGLVDDGVSLRLRRGRRRSDRGAEAIPSLGGNRAAGVRPAGVGRRVERREDRRAYARRVPTQARGVAADARTQGAAHRGRPVGDDVPLDRGAVGRLRRAVARAWADRLAGDVLRPGRRGLRPPRARSYRGGVPARRHHPRARLVNVDQIIAALDRGEVRVAEPVDGEWRVNSAAQAAILEYFRSRRMEPQEVGPFEYHDKIPLKRNYEELGVRVVPPAVARYGAYLAPGVVMMPSYVNIGAWVGPRTMVDTWATVGSGAQIGADVHLAGGVGIGGVLEPPGATPVIVEDGAFIGSRCILTEGVRVGAGAVLGPNVSLTASVPIIDVTGSDPVEHRGSVPPRAIVVPGTRPKEFPAGMYHLACALIVGWRSEATDLKVSLNEALREHGLGS